MDTKISKSAREILINVLTRKQTKDAITGTLDEGATAAHDQDETITVTDHDKTIRQGLHNPSNVQSLQNPSLVDFSGFAPLQPTTVPPIATDLEKTWSQETISLDSGQDTIIKQPGPRDTQLTSTPRNEQNQIIPGDFDLSSLQTMIKNLYPHLPNSDDKVEQMSINQLKATGAFPKQRTNVNGPQIPINPIPPSQLQQRINTEQTLIHPLSKEEKSSNQSEQTNILTQNRAATSQLGSANVNSRISDPISHINPIGHGAMGVT